MTQSTTAAHAACAALDHVEVVGDRELDELDLVARGPRRLARSRGSGRRDDVVPRAVDEQLRHAEREQRGGRRGRVALGHLVGPAAEQALTGAVAEIGSRPPARSATPAQRDRSAPARTRPPRREPESEVPSRRVPGGDDPARVDLLAARRRGRARRPRPRASPATLLPPARPGGTRCSTRRGRAPRDRARAASSASGPSPSARTRRGRARRPARGRQPSGGGGSRPGRDGRRRRSGAPEAACGSEPPGSLYARSARRRERASSSVSMSASVL